MCAHSQKRHTRGKGRCHEAGRSASAPTSDPSPSCVAYRCPSFVWAAAPHPGSPPFQSPQQAERRGLPGRGQPVGSTALRLPGCRHFAGSPPPSLILCESRSALDNRALDVPPPKSSACTRPSWTVALRPGGHALPSRFSSHKGPSGLSFLSCPARSVCASFSSSNSTRLGRRPSPTPGGPGHLAARSRQRKACWADGRPWPLLLGLSPPPPPQCSAVLHSPRPNLLEATEAVISDLPQPSQFISSHLLFPPP